MSYLIILENCFLLNGKLPWEFNFFQTNWKTRQEKQDEIKQDITTRNSIARLELTHSKKFE